MSKSTCQIIQNTWWEQWVKVLTLLHQQHWLAEANSVRCCANSIAAFVKHVYCDSHKRGDDGNRCTDSTTNWIHESKKSHYQLLCNLLCIIKLYARVHYSAEFIQRGINSFKLRLISAFFCYICWFFFWHSCYFTLALLRLCRFIICSLFP